MLVCAQKDCDVYSLDAPNEGVFFDLQEIIFPKKISQKNTQVTTFKDSSASFFGMKSGLRG